MLWRPEHGRRVSWAVKELQDEEKRQQDSLSFLHGNSYLAGMSPYISLKIKKRHYEHHMIEAHKYLITWISDDIFFLNSG
jgi:hypothetical protein